MATRHVLRSVRHFTTTLVVGAFALLVVASDWEYTRTSRRGQVLLTSSGFRYRNSPAFADAIHYIDGSGIKATVRSRFSHLRAGQTVRVCYPPRDPADLLLDEFWERHFATVITLAILAAVVILDVARWKSSEPHSARKPHDHSRRSPDVLSKLAPYAMILAVGAIVFLIVVGLS